MLIAMRKPVRMIICICAAFLGILAAACPGNAASITVQGDTITFTEPEGYINTAGGNYQIFFDTMQEILGKTDQKHLLRYLFLAREDAEAFDAGQSGSGRLIAVMAYELSMTLPEFQKYKDEIKRTFDPDKEYATQPQEKSLGIVNEGLSEISSLALWRHDPPLELTSMYLSTVMLRNGKPIQVVHYETFTDMARAEAFAQEALKRVEAMNFPSHEGASALVTSAAALVVFTLCAFAYGMFRFRPKKG